ncbi:fimbrial assembly protein PilN [Pseudoduganella lurida]|uniref:Fimbrial assembly protein PilN n=1 Tax=Pseudoduganella lurida TaxID=1036180 RepID=A0A562R9L2_9BURK|nr:PilN domain-containing protein [Pseudoduganella lurida]TWI65120.1 fimbrial assembly protein PilN [Pseudoduganella lurida]
MKPIRIDFAPPSLRRALFRLHPALAAAGLAGVLLCGGGIWFATQLAGERAARAAQVERLQARQAALSKRPAAVVQTAIPEAQAVAVNAAILQLNVPWRELDDAIGAATPSTIALLALEPDAKKQMLKITAEAKNSDDMVDYVRSLQQQEFFLGAALARHEIGEQDAGRAIRFQVDVQWRAR